MNENVNSRSHSRFERRAEKVRKGSKVRPTSNDAFITITSGLLDVEQRVGESNLDTEDEELSDSESDSNSDNDQ